MESIGPYRIEREVARGGMGVVYRGQDPRLQRSVAIKVILTASPDERDLARFLREGQALAALKHPNVLAILDSGQVDRHPYLVVEWIEGGSLQDRLDRDGPLPIDEVLRVGETMAATLAHCHAQGVLHRDLKPHNVMVEGERLVIADFGLAALRGSDQRLTLSTEALGTPGFMAPEQTGGEEVGPAADVYGIGATLYALLVGRPPFEGSLVQVLSSVINKLPEMPRKGRPDCPPALEQVIVRCLAKDPAARYASASDLADALTATRADASPRGDPLIRVGVGVAVALLVVLAALLAMRDAPPVAASPTASSAPAEPSTLPRPTPRVTASPSPAPSLPPAPADLELAARKLGPTLHGDGGFIVGVFPDGEDSLVVDLWGFAARYRPGSAQPVWRLRRPGEGAQKGAAFDAQRRVLYLSRYKGGEIFRYRVPSQGRPQPLESWRHPKSARTSRKLPLVASLRVLADGRLLSAGAERLRLWSPAGETLRDLDTGEADRGVYTLSLHEPWVYVATHGAGAVGGSLHRFDLRDGAKVTLPFLGAVFSVEPSPDGAFLATGGADGVVRVRRLADRELLWERRVGRIPSGQEHCFANTVVWSEDGALLINGNNEGVVRVLRARDGHVLAEWVAQPPVVRRGRRVGDWASYLRLEGSELLTGGNFGGVNRYRLR